MMIHGEAEFQGEVYAWLFGIDETFAAVGVDETEGLLAIAADRLSENIVRRLLFHEVSRPVMRVIIKVQTEESISISKVSLLHSWAERIHTSILENFANRNGIQVPTTPVTEETP